MIFCIVVVAPAARFRAGPRVTVKRPSSAGLSSGEAGSGRPHNAAAMVHSRCIGGRRQRGLTCRLSDESSRGRRCGSAHRACWSVRRAAHRDRQSLEAHTARARMLADARWRPGTAVLPGRAATGSAWTRGISAQETTFHHRRRAWPALRGSAGMRAARGEVEPVNAPAPQAGDQPVPGA